MTMANRAIASARARRALAHLAAHPDTTAKQLGDARDLANRVNTWPSQDVHEPIYGLECIVADVYGGAPDCAPNCECGN